MQRVDECWTHPSEAFVMMYVLPTSFAPRSNVCTMRSRDASCSRTCDGMAPY